MKNTLYCALAKAQGSYTVAEMDGYNPHFKSSFSSYKALVDASRPALSQNGLCVVHLVFTEKTKVSVETRICGPDSHFVSCTLSATARDDKPQSIGSVISFLKRYGYSSLTGVTSGEKEDDGEIAEGRTAQVPPTRVSPPQPAKNPQQEAASLMNCNDMNALRATWMACTHKEHSMVMAAKEEAKARLSAPPPKKDQSAMRRVHALAAEKFKGDNDQRHKMLRDLLQTSSLTLVTEKELSDLAAQLEKWDPSTKPTPISIEMGTVLKEARGTEEAVAYWEAKVLPNWLAMTIEERLYLLAARS